MRRFTMALLCAVLALLPAAAGAATLRVYTPFADMDAGAQGWEEIVRAWEAETGNTCEDYSGLQDEQWMDALRADLSAGKADLVVLPVGSGFTGSELVTAAELAEAGAAGARSLPAMAEKDGAVLLSPVRWGFETLYVNTDVLAAAGLQAPESWEDLVVACAVLSQMGTLPIANALTEWAEIVLDCAALIAAPAEEFGAASSLEGASGVLSSLVMVGGFGGDPWNAEDEQTAEAFLSGQAAMRFDSWDFALSVPQERTEHVRVIALPGIEGGVRRSLPGELGCGVAVSRACRQDGEKWQAALSLAGKLLSAESAQALMLPAGGALAESMAELTASTEAVCGVLYDKNPEGFDDWAEKTVSSLMTPEAQE